MSLYNKHRPKALNEIIGNRETVTVLEELLNKENPPHSYLLYGPTGCGKTTIGRIIADRLNTKGADLIEINTADFRGIDTVRDIIKDTQYLSLLGKNKVFIIDECHKLTNDAQNAFLKILEEPPSHTYFILLTTEPQKLLDTVKGRCIQLQVSPLDTLQMIRLLRKISHKEGKEVEYEVLEQIAIESFGYPRNAITTLEQILSVPKEMQKEIAKKSTERQIASIELCRALIQRKSWKEVREILKGLKDKDVEEMRRQILAYCQTILLTKEDDNIAAIMEAFLEPYYNTGFSGFVYSCYSVTH